MAQNARVPRNRNSAVAGDVRVERDYTVEVAGKRFDVKVIGDPVTSTLTGVPVGAGPVGRAAPKRTERKTLAGSGVSGDTLTTPLQGTIFKIAVEQGATVQEGDLICVIEAMKMENEITAHKTGTITQLPITTGASVSVGDTIAVIKGDS